MRRARMETFGRLSGTSTRRSVRNTSTWHGCASANEKWAPRSTSWELSGRTCMSSRPNTLARERGEPVLATHEDNFDAQV